MRNIILASFVAAGLAACQTSQIDSSIQTALGAVCPKLQISHSGFVALAMVSDKVAEYADEEARAYAALSVACANPSAVTSQNILVVIASAYQAWEVAGVR